MLLHVPRRVLWLNLGLGFVLVALVGLGFAALRPQGAIQEGRTVPAQSGSVIETVTATGTVESSGTQGISFQVSGSGATLLVDAGTEVRQGEELARLDGAAQKQALTDARSAYVQAVANANAAPLTLAAMRENVAEAERVLQLNKSSYAQNVRAASLTVTDAQSSWSEECLTASGSCPDDAVWSQLRAAETDVVTARTSYSQAVQTAAKAAETNQVKLGQAKVNVDAAQSKKTNQCSLYGSDSSSCLSAVEALRGYEQAYALQVKANETSDVAAQQSLVDTDLAVTNANIALRRLQSSLRSSATDALRVAQSALESATLAQKQGLEADRQNLQSAREALAMQVSAQGSVVVGRRSLTPTEASVRVARAALKAAQQDVSDTVLRAPISGTLARWDIDSGAMVTSGAPVATILPDAPWEVVAEFSEADALKLAIGQSASIAFDALPGEVATGVVSSLAILPSSGSSEGRGTTASNGVTTYSATVTLDSASENVRQGMSVSVVVTTARVDNVVWAPPAAITTVGAVTTVTIRRGDVDSIVEISTGLAGDSGTEVTSGVVAGDQLVIAVGEGAAFSRADADKGDGAGNRPPAGKDAPK